jgi:hypothetical protein
VQHALGAGNEGKEEQQGRGLVEKDGAANCHPKPELQSV